MAAARRWMPPAERRPPAAGGCGFMRLGALRGVPRPYLWPWVMLGSGWNLWGCWTGEQSIAWGDLLQKAQANRSGPEEGCGAMRKPLCFPRCDSSKPSDCHATDIHAVGSRDGTGPPGAHEQETIVSPRVRLHIRKWVEPQAPQALSRASVDADTFAGKNRVQPRGFRRCPELRRIRLASRSIFRAQAS